MKFVEVGAGWRKEEEGKKKRMSAKLNNGMFLTMWPNDRKEEGSNQPDYKLTMDFESAEKLGLLSDYDKEHSGETVDPSNIEF